MVADRLQRYATAPQPKVHFFTSLSGPRQMERPVVGAIRDAARAFGQQRESSKSQTRAAGAMRRAAGNFKSETRKNMGKLTSLSARHIAKKQAKVAAISVAND